MIFKKMLGTLSATLLLASCQNGSFYKKQPKKPVVVYVDMVADLFHFGHVSFLKKAKEQGDYLIVGIIGDEVATEYKRVPIMTLQERAEMVRSCRYVDEVIEDSPLVVPSAFLDEHKIDRVVHGDDYSEELSRYCFQSAIDRGIYKAVPYTAGISTSDIIKRILNRAKETGISPAAKNENPETTLEKEETIPAPSSLREDPIPEEEEKEPLEKSLEPSHSSLPPKERRNEAIEEPALLVDF